MVGCTIHILLTGLTLSMFTRFLTTSRFSREPPWMRTIILTTFIFNLFQLGVTVGDVIYWAATQEREYDHFFEGTYMDSLTPLFDGVIAFLVQGVYGWRAWTLFKSKWRKRVFVAVLVPTMLAGVFSAFVVLVLNFGYATGKFDHAGLLTFNTMASLWLWCSFAADTGISVTLWFLFRSNVAGFNQSMDSVLLKLARLAIQSGSYTAITALLAAAFTDGFMSDYTVAIPYVFLSLYTISLFSGDLIEVVRSTKKITKSDRVDLQSSRAPESMRGEPAESTADSDEVAKLLYSKSKVYLHPSAYQRDNIPGFLSIVSIHKPTQKESYLLSWIPEAAIEGTPDWESYVLVELGGTTDETTLVTLPPPSSSHAFSIPLASLYSLVIQPPTLTSWHGSLTFTQYAQPSLPPLYFHDEESRSTLLDRDRRTEALGAMGALENWSPGSVGEGTSRVPPSWGGESVLNMLRVFVKVVRSKIEPQLFLVNPSKEDAEVHGTALFDDDVVPRTGLGINGSGVPGGYPDDLAGARGGDMDNFTFSVFNSLGRITRGARSAAQTLIPHLPSAPLRPHTARATAPGELTRLTDSAGVGGYDAARVYLAKWARVVAEEGERARKLEVLVQGSEGREDEETGAFEVLASTYNIVRPLSTRASGTPIVVTEWAAWFDDHGQLMLDESEAKKRIFQRGFAADVRKDVWPFLLKVYPWQSTTDERKKIQSELNAEYERLKQIWHVNDVRNTDRFTKETHQIEIDCRRTDRTHPMFQSGPVDPAEWADSPHPPSNHHVKKTQEILTTYVFADAARDYVQGMSDLLSPLYVVCEADAALAYWCFVEVMETQKDNFLVDQSGMKRQLSELQRLIGVMDGQMFKHLEETGSLNLFFCFRWILCSFKRELSFDATLQLWEVLWTNHLGTHFHLFFALAIIEQHRDVIIRYLREFDEILKYVNELSQTLDVDSLLADAEILYYTFCAVLNSSEKRKQEELARRNPSVGGLRRRAGKGVGGASDGGDGEEKEDGEGEAGKSDVEEIDQVLWSLKL
ncbi:GTPase activating protein [Pseudohyphozyma bogoriensis]|nr:GTPase activating protein [Pseudohyphozyma bogoriensis]